MDHLLENLLWLLVILGIFFGIVVPLTAEILYRLMKWMERKGRW